MSARRWMQGLVVAMCGLSAVAPALAQTQSRPAARPAIPAAPAKADPQELMRYQIAVMEGVLETAVQRGAQVMLRQWRAVAPDMMLMGGTARARGFRLDGYGMFFVVDVPTMQQSVVWTLRMLDRESGGTDAALQSIRDFVKSVPDPVQRKALEQDIRRIEVQVAPYSRTVDPNAAGPGGVPGMAAPRIQAATPVSAVPAPAEAMVDPNDAYTSEVKSALVDAMLDYSQALPVGPDESLIVAARGNPTRGVGADDSGDLMTIMIRIKGSDLQAFRAGKFTRDEVRKRVEIREY